MPVKFVIVIGDHDQPFNQRPPPRAFERGRAWARRHALRRPVARRHEALPRALGQEACVSGSKFSP